MSDVDKMLKKNSQEHSKILQHKYRTDIEELKKAGIERDTDDNREKYKENRQGIQQQLDHLKSGAKASFAELLNGLCSVSLLIWLDDMEKKYNRYTAGAAAAKNAPWPESSSPYSIEMDKDGNINKLFAVDYRNAAAFSNRKHQDRVTKTFLTSLKEWSAQEPRKWELTEDQGNIFFKKEDGTKVTSEEFISQKNNPESSFHNFLKDKYQTTFGREMKPVDKSADDKSQELSQRPPAPGM